MLPLYRRCFTRDEWKCRHCGDRNGIHPHHVIYQSHQGPNELTNLITLCAQCHRAHHDGFLDIEVLWIITNDVVVKFTRKKGWKPT
jgi:HNH endonuclease